MQLSGAFIQTIVNMARDASLSTIDHKNNPHIVPIVFAFDRHYYYIPPDNKRKTQTAEKLKRVRNIQHNPNVALLIDECNEDWSKLVFVMIQGKAYLIGNKEEKGHENINNYDNNESLLTAIHKLLYEKYPQYKEVGIGQCCIKIQPQKIIYWKNDE